MADTIQSELTVAKLIELLNQFPSDALVIINDADTDWSLWVNEVKLWRGFVMLAGNYERGGPRE